MRGLLAVALLSTFLAACNCGPPTAGCTSLNCTGCCDSSGECQGGVEVAACGSTGATCVTCTGSQQCQLGLCVGAAGGGSGDDAGLDAGTTDSGVADAGTIDSGVADSGIEDSGIADSGVADSGVADSGVADSGVADSGIPDAGRPDAGAPDAGPTHVHILISNTCVVSTQPASITASLNSGLKLDFHNHSVDYQADVWSSRGYGYLQLATGGLWHDPITHCGGPNPYTEYFDVDIAGGGGTACPGVRFNIHCQ